MKPLLLIVTACIATFAADDEKTTRWPVTKAFYEMAGSVIEKGLDFWNNISVQQAGQIAQIVVTSAGNLRNDNDVLLNDLSRRNINSQQELNSRVEKLRSTLQALNKQLTDFATEIDKAAAGIGDQLRNVANDASVGKSNELIDVERSWEPNDPSKAIGHLKEANTNLDRIRTAARCLQETIEKKKAACDPEKLKAELK